MKFLVLSFMIGFISCNSVVVKNEAKNHVYVQKDMLKVNFKNIRIFADSENETDKNYRVYNSTFSDLGSGLIGFEVDFNLENSGSSEFSYTIEEGDKLIHSGSEQMHFDKPGEFSYTCHIKKSVEKGSYVLKVIVDGKLLTETGFVIK
ncbi:MAG: hypothetical protein JXR48_11785 [Candidatus Delongbacteria bacterium]|nr:hypothetical protein [Candidatus Delongbacteria bacterium]MBN2835632.1 hypothetical protein [Candidatus Delongbacteria bacterium]